jgi:bacterioferritin B
MSSARCCSITPSLLIFDAEALLELSAHFHKQAEEEKKHALRFIQFVTNTGARVNIPAASAPEAHFKVAEDAVKLSLEQEERVTNADQRA